MRMEGNVTDILDAYAYGYRNRNDVLDNFKGSKSLYSQGVFRFNSDYVVAANSFLRDSINKAENLSYQTKTFGKDRVAGTGPIKINMTNPTAEDFENIKKLKKGEVYIPIVNGEIFDTEMVKDIRSPSPNNKTGVVSYKYLSSISPIIGQ